MERYCRLDKGDFNFPIGPGYSYPDDIAKNDIVRIKGRTPTYSKNYMRNYAKNIQTPISNWYILYFVRRQGSIWICECIKRMDLQTAKYFELV